MSRIRLGIPMFFAIVAATTLLRGQVPHPEPKSMAAAPTTSPTIQQADQAAEPAATPVTITYGGKSTVWTVPKMAELPHKTITLHNEHLNADQTFSGVPLIQLLIPLGVPEKPKGRDFRLYLVAEGRDGYKVVFALGEVSPDVHDGTVLLADSVDGKPIKENGPFQLVCTGEKRPARWVRNVVAIRIMAAD